MLFDRGLDRVGFANRHAACGSRPLGDISVLVAQQVHDAVAISACVTDGFQAGQSEYFPLADCAEMLAGGALLGFGRALRLLLCNPTELAEIGLRDACGDASRALVDRVVVRDRADIMQVVAWRVLRYRKRPLKRAFRNLAVFIRRLRWRGEALPSIDRPAVAVMLHPGRRQDIAGGVLCRGVAG